MSQEIDNSILSREEFAHESEQVALWQRILRTMISGDENEKRSLGFRNFPSLPRQVSLTASLLRKLPNGLWEQNSKIRADPFKLFSQSDLSHEKLTALSGYFPLGLLFATAALEHSPSEFEEQRVSKHCCEVSAAIELGLRVLEEVRETMCGGSCDLHPADSKFQEITCQSIYEETVKKLEACVEAHRGEEQQEDKVVVVEEVTDCLLDDTNSIFSSYFSNLSSRVSIDEEKLHDLIQVIEMRARTRLEDHDCLQRRHANISFERSVSDFAMNAGEDVIQGLDPLFDSFMEEDDHSSAHTESSIFEHSRADSPSTRKVDEGDGESDIRLCPQRSEVEGWYNSQGKPAPAAAQKRVDVTGDLPTIDGEMDLNQVVDGLKLRSRGDYHYT